MPRTSASPCSGRMKNAGLIRHSGKDHKSAESATSCREAPRKNANHPQKKPWTTASRMSVNQKVKNSRNVFLYELWPFAAVAGSTLSGYTNEAARGCTYTTHKTSRGSQRSAE